MLPYSLALALHTVAAVIWVGGMFFAHMALRPALAAMEPAERLGLWLRLLPRFFAWVWAAVLALLATGYGMLFLGYLGGLGGGGMTVDVMQVTGLVMMVLFVYLFFAPWQAFKRAMKAGDLAEAAENQARIRRIVTVNLVLGLVTTAIGASGAAGAY